jgi:hypothetical protein
MSNNTPFEITENNSMRNMLLVTQLRLHIGVGVDISYNNRSNASKHGIMTSITSRLTEDHLMLCVEAINTCSEVWSNSVKSTHTSPYNTSK